jgi:hypothetical protein
MLPGIPIASYTHLGAMLEYSFEGDSYGHPN